MKFEEYSKTFLFFHTDDVPLLLSKYIKTSSSNTLVDLGAGDGTLLIALQLGDFLNHSNEIIAVDLSSERCERLANYTDFKVLCSDATSVPEINTNSVDFVICTQVIEHVDEEKLLSEIKRILKPDGKLYIASLIKKWYGWWYYRNAKGVWSMDPTHLREYSSQHEYENVIKQNGFNIIETVTSPLKLSLFEFIVRRVIVPVFNPKNINSFFIKYPIANAIRKNINVHPPGYFIVETVAEIKK